MLRAQDGCIDHTRCAEGKKRQLRQDERANVHAIRAAVISVNALRSAQALVEAFIYFYTFSNLQFYLAKRVWASCQALFNSWP